MMTIEIGAAKSFILVGHDVLTIDCSGKRQVQFFDSYSNAEMEAYCHKMRACAIELIPIWSRH
jgi:hypothetical protein